MRSLPNSYRQRYFTMAEDGPQAVYQVGPQLQAMVEFGYINLHDPASSPFAPLPFMGGRGEGVDVIFCQNVLIYFTAEDRLAIVQRLCQRLRPGGCLFLGPAEVVGLRLPGIQSLQLPDVLLYQRT
jgi:chemotaxis protein methyltransferase CheR